MPANRRDFVKFAGGAAVGIAATPIPWKLLDDTAIWTQNWDAIPKLPRGPLETRSTVCTLCAAGCAVQASLVGGVPVRLKGRLCPAGLGSYQLPWHPFRLREAQVEGRVVDIASARPRVLESISTARKPVAILDGRPGRTASRMYRQAAAAWSNGIYITPVEVRNTGVDMDRIDTVVGFGAPVLEGAAPWARGKRVIQVDARHSLTASLADRWFAVKPGSEPQVAVAIARKCAKPAELAAALASQDAEQLAIDAGLDVAAFGDLVTLFEGGRAFAAGPNASLLNSIASRAALVERREVPDGTAADVRTMRLADAAPNSLSVLIVDATSLDIDVSPRMLRRLLDPDGLLVVLSAFSSALTDAAGVAIPAAAPFESWDDVPPAAESKAATYAAAAPLLPAPEGVVVPAEFAAQLAGLDGELAKEIEARAAAIHASGRGSTGKRVAEMDAAEFWEAISSGATWTDDPSNAPKPRPLPEFVQANWTPEPELPHALIPFRTLEAPWHRAQPPVLTKLYQESDLRPAGGTVRIHPETAAASGVQEGREAVIRTRDGECRVRVHIDRLVQRGVIEAPLSPSRAELAGKAKPSMPRVLELTGGAPVVAARIERA